METKEKRFLLSKNSLDNHHQKLLTYLELEVMTIATAVISLGLYLYSEGQILTLYALVTLGMLLAYFRHKAYSNEITEIEKEIASL